MATLVYVRAPMKVAGVVLEPTYIWHDGGTGGPHRRVNKCSSLRTNPGIPSAAGPSRSSLREAPAWTPRWKGTTNSGIADRYDRGLDAGR